jgi:hypothetical protein
MLTNLSMGNSFFPDERPGHFASSSVAQTEASSALGWDEAHTHTHTHTHKQALEPSLLESERVVRESASLRQGRAAAPGAPGDTARGRV